MKGEGAYQRLFRTGLFLGMLVHLVCCSCCSGIQAQVADQIWTCTFVNHAGNEDFLDHLGRGKTDRSYF